MFKKIRNIFYIISFLSFIVAIMYFYFSDTNISMVNKTRSIYPNGLTSQIQDLQILENDTIDIILYRDDIDEFKKNKKKYTFWDLLKKIK